MIMEEILDLEKKVLHMLESMERENTISGEVEEMVIGTKQG